MYPGLLCRQSQAGSSVQLVDERVDDHEADEDGKDPGHPTHSPAAARALSAARGTGREVSATSWPRSRCMTCLSWERSGGCRSCSGTPGPCCASFMAGAFVVMGR